MSVEYDSNVVTVSVAGAGTEGVINVLVVSGTLPISGATVFASDESSSATYGPFLTLGNGRVVISLPPGMYALTVSASGYTNAGQSGIVVTTGGVVSVTISLVASIPYSQSMSFASQSGASTTGIIANYKDVNSIPITCQCNVVVHNSLGQTVAVGQSVLQTIQPNRVAAFLVSWSALAHGTYSFDFFCTDQNSVAVSVVTTLQIGV